MKADEPVDIKAYDRNVATKIIEDFMLVANETVAEDYFWQEIPFLYRVHETPDDDKMKKLVTFLQNFGYTMHMQGGQEIRPKEVQKLLDKIEGTPEEAMISRLALRSMKQARYSPDKTDISDLRPSIIRILLHRSGAIRICRSTGSSKIIFEAG